MGQVPWPSPDFSKSPEWNMARDREIYRRRMRFHLLGIALMWSSAAILIVVTLIAWGIQ